MGRHDRVVNELAKHFKARNNVDVKVEPNLKTRVGLRKPDLLLIENGEATIIDVQVVNGCSVERDHANKLAKYRDIPGMNDLIKTKFGVHTVKFQAVTISHKGMIEKDTSKTLKKLGINEQLRFLIVTSVLRGAWINWTLFNRITTMTRRVRGRL